MKVFAKYLIAALFPALTLGCASAKYIDEGSDDSIVNVGQINTQDWIHAADQLTQSLMLSGAIQAVAGKPKILMIGRIKNNTATHIDTDSLMKKIRVSLNKSGRALTTTAVGLDGPEDASSKAVRELRADDEFNQGTIPSKGNLVSPDYSLSGKIIQNNARAGRIKQSEFAFQLTLTDLKTGLAIWEEEKLIVKQGARAAVGW
ncbi:MAG: penicillin-binding protein activator LpoB [Verrucomicrobiota bacterium]|jgi:uncharacterized protein (TIGR02722 family)|nr:penicillin-binding protein activator LpoB [Verrucomicrobiota bacterium]